MDAIKNRKIRKRTLELPIVVEQVSPARHPKTGRVLAQAKVPSGARTKRCPLNEHGTYTLTERQPLLQWRQAATERSTCARGVLWWIARCEESPRTVRVTVLDVQRIGQVWVVRFALDTGGDVKDHVDARPIFLARSAGFTTSSDEIKAGEFLPPLGEDLAAARKRAREGAIAPQRQALDSLASEIKTCREVMQGIKARNRLALALKEVERAQAELAAESAATVRAKSVCAVRQAPVEAEDEPRPHGTCPVVSLESAA